MKLYILSPDFKFCPPPIVYNRQNQKNLFLATFIQLVLKGLYGVLIVEFKSLFWPQQKQPPEMFCKKLFLEIVQNSQGNTCVVASFLIKLQFF